MGAVDLQVHGKRTLLLHGSVDHRHEVADCGVDLRGLGLSHCHQNVGCGKVSITKHDSLYY